MRVPACGMSHFAEFQAFNFKLKLLSEVVLTYTSKVNHTQKKLEGYNQCG